jgi:hypothetical protein
MSAFARTYLLLLNGEEVKVTTRPGDILNAERDMTREKIENAATSAPMHMQFRIVWRAWLRDRPESLPFARFMDALEDMSDLDAEVDPVTEPLSPTLPADTGSLP